ncbi:sarcosine oxidase subunit gamma family protein, partial [Pseudomonas syringae pv. tagetis]
MLGGWGVVTWVVVVRCCFWDYWWLWLQDACGEYGL